MPKVTDTIFRDAHQSLLATRMRTEDMLPIAEKVDQLGFFSLEVWGGATFDTCIRFLGEDPWERLRTLKKALPKTRLQMLLRGQNLVGYRHYADDVAEKFVINAAKNGVDIFRIFDALNDIRNMEFTIKVAKAQGAHVQGTASYTLSPVHNTDTYLRLFDKLVHLGCDSLCIKDMAGLITPTAAYELVTAVKREFPTVLLDIHSHCTAGLAPISYYAACQAGVDIIDTAISPLGGGTSQPPTETLVEALANTPQDTGINLRKLMEVREYFAQLKEKYRCYLDPIAEQTDTNVLRYQVPGGMLSNLVSQLKQQNALNKYEDVLLEIPKVRADLGYPPLVTPTSQIVGTQAVFNVLFGERYKMISKEVKEYVRGFYGKTPAPIPEEIKKIVIGDEKPITVRPADLIEHDYEKKKKELTEKGLLAKEEDVLTYALYPEVAVKFFKGEIKVERPVPCEEKKAPEVKPAAEEPLGDSYREFKVEVSGKVFTVKVAEKDMEEDSYAAYSDFSVPQAKKEEKKAAVSGNGKCVITSPMQGMILDVMVNVGDDIKEGSVIAILEAMKMQNEILADKGGIVKEINVKKGQIIELGEVIAIISSGN